MPPVAIRLWQKLSPAVVVGSGQNVEMVGVPPAAFIFKTIDAAGEAIESESVAVTVMVVDAAAVGVPVMTPVVAFRVAQFGSPCATQFRAPVPPFAASCAE